MGKEIERKFLLRTDAWRDEVTDSVHLIQGYLARNEQSAIRVRIKGTRAELNIKQTLDGIDRLEYEYEIPLVDAREILEHVALRPLIEKTRHRVLRGDHVWEIDEFDGENRGLIMAEIELADADEAFEKPSWIGEEVSLDPRYYNSNLIVSPYQTW
jgi:adenylate cyclase